MLDSILFPVLLLLSTSSVITVTDAIFNFYLHISVFWMYRHGSYNLISVIQAWVRMLYLVSKGMQNLQWKFCSEQLISK
jgi:hypothetical protein